MKPCARLLVLVSSLVCLQTGSVIAELPTSAPAPIPAQGAAQPSPTVPAPSPAASPAPVFTPETTPAPIDPAKEAEIRQLLALTGAEKLVEQMKKQLFAVFRQHATQLPQEFWDRMDQDMDSKKLLDKMVPLYDKYYSLDDLKALNAFYQTPAGQHLLQNQPLIMKDSMSIGQDWGRQAGLKVMLEMQNYKQRMSTTPPSGTNTPQPAPPAPPAGN